MDTLNLALKLMGKEKTTEERNEAVNPSTASIIHMIAVTSSSGGKVVLKDEIESSADWNEGEYIEIEEDGAFEEYESEDDPLEDVDDSIVDLTDGDGADIEETDEESVSFSVGDYHAAAVEAYATEAANETEVESTEDELADENASITDVIDDGDATELPDDGGTSEEDDLADEYATIGEITDDEYTLIDDNLDDESEDYVEGAEVSDGYTVAECIGSINAGDRVAVMVQDGKVVVLGVVGSGDEQRANTEIAQETADEANGAAEIAQAAADHAQEQADEAQGKANEAHVAAENAQAQANTAEAAALEAQSQAQNAIQQSQVAQEHASAAQGVADAVRQDVEQAEKDLLAYAASLETLSNTMQADYAKKTELSAFEASVQTQISQNAGEIASVASKVEEVDETVSAAVGEAKQQAEAAVNAAQQAQSQAQAAQTTANTAQAAAEAAQSEADTAQAAAEAAQRIANQAESDLETAKQNLSEVTSRVDATEEEIEAAEAAVSAAQSAADAAKADAASAQSTANTAAANAASAQTAAANAKSAADAAQTAANKAQADVNSLGVRVTNAETRIQQNADQIALMATKTEVAQTLGGYYTKTQTDAAIKVSSDAIASTVTSVKEQATEAQTTADAANKDIDTAKSEIEQLSDQITNLVQSGSKFSIMKQTAEGWVFDMTTYDKAIADMVKNAEYVRVGNYKYIDENGTEQTIPCIELGESDSDFKIRITNKDLQFASGSDVPAYIKNFGNTSKLMIKQAEIVDELQQGGFVWKKRANGNLGLMWKGVS